MRSEHNRVFLRENNIINIPSQEEQRIAADYVLKRELYRPDTSIKKAAGFISAYIIINLILGGVSFFLLQWFDIFLLMPDPLHSFYKNHFVSFYTCYVLLIFCITGFLCAKAAVIGAIKLYQHYAPDEIRRRCLFKPTCSEYAVLAVKKYGVIVGLVKTYFRLFRRCRGNIYRIDYP